VCGILFFAILVALLAIPGGRQDGNSLRTPTEK
jgi:hypothetical protein